MPDYSKVSQLFAVYAATQDEKDFATLKDVFTEDCTFTVDITGGPTVGPYEDRASTLEFIEGAIQAQDDQRRHVITNVRLDGDVAYAILSLFVTKDGALTAQATGVYKCDVVDQGGEPRFSSMYLTLDRPY
jgi:ketosteroid isomerase-like protein